MMTLALFLQLLSKLCDTVLALQTESVCTSTEDDKLYRVSLYLALPEEIFGQLKRWRKQRRRYREFLKVMGDIGSKHGTSPNNIVVPGRVLLISSPHMTEQLVKDARRLCVKAMGVLAEAGLGCSTFEMNATSNLVSVYLMEGHLGKTKSVSHRSWNWLNIRSQTEILIYVDALGVCQGVYGTGEIQRSG